MTTSASRHAAAAQVSQPWWRYRFVWLVAGLPASAVVAATASGIIAIRGADPVVAEYRDAARQAAEESLSREEASRIPAELARNHAATPHH
jgi:uncharacterized protein